jgi:hypothetical protein
MESGQFEKSEIGNWKLAMDSHRQPAVDLNHLASDVASIV